MTEDQAVAIIDKAQERLARHIQWSSWFTSVVGKIQLIAWAIFQTAIPAFFAGLAIWGLIWVMDNVFKIFGWR